MSSNNLYDAIAMRKSIRKYDPKPLSDEVLSNVMNYIKTLNPLFPEIKTEISIVSPDAVKGIIQVKAPHYIVAFSESKEGNFANIGFMLQQLDLFFSSNGIGCCWQGWPKPTRELRTDKNLDFMIALAFGAPKESLHRKSAQEFKRKSLDEITDSDKFNELLESARLAPYGSSESWFFTSEDNVIHAFCATGRIMKLNMIENMNKINLGIALCHLWAAAKHFGRPFEAVVVMEAQEHAPVGYRYCISIKTA
jgi:hypothetical protein